MSIVAAANEDCSLLIFLSVCEDIKWPSHSPDASLAGGIHTAHLSRPRNDQENINFFLFRKTILGPDFYTNVSIWLGEK